MTRKTVQVMDPFIIDVEAAPISIDLDALQHRSDTNLVPAHSAQLATIPTTRELIDPRELETIYTTTFPRRILDAFVDGEAILCVGIAGCVGLVAAVVVEFILWAVALVVSVTSAAVAYGPTILGVLVAVILLPILFGGRRAGGNGMVTVKGCAKSGFVGPITIRRY